MRIYLDIETFRLKNEEAFVKEKIIAIGIIEDQTPYKPVSSGIWNNNKVNIHFFTEWELGGEKHVVSNFYDYFERLIEEKKKGKTSFLNVIGFNILRFDIPLLIQKGVEYEIGSLGELNNLWYEIMTTDYLQTSLPFNKMRFKGLNLEFLVKKANFNNIEILEPYGSGGEVKEWYKNKEYNKIINHLERDLKILRIIDLNYKYIYDF